MDDTIPVLAVAVARGPDAEATHLPLVCSSAYPYTVFGTVAVLLPGTEEMGGGAHLGCSYSVAAVEVVVTLVCLDGGGANAYNAPVESVVVNGRGVCWAEVTGKAA